MTQALQHSNGSSGAGAVVATVGCSVLGMMLAGPVGAVIGGTLAIAATATTAHRAAQQRMSLNISSISMPHAGITRQHGVTFFALDVVDTQGATWRVLRRYNQFDRFRRTLHRAGVRKAFPGKLWFGCEGARLRERRLGLEQWTREVVRIFSTSGVPGRLEAEFNDFFTRARGQVTTADALPDGCFPIEVPAGVSAGQQLTVKNPVDGSSFNIVVPPGMGPGSILQVQPAPREAKPRDGGSGSLPDAAVCPTPHGSFREAEFEPQKTLLSISIPPGVLPGQTIAVKVPDGRELHVTVPEGAGQELQLELDAANGKLSVLGEAAADPASSSGGDIFQINVPAGVQPGQMVNIQVPDGRHLPFTVPAGKRPGDELLLCLDTTRSRLLLAQS